MAEAWASAAGIDLHLEIGGPRVRAALEEALREAVRSGRLAAGARVPSSRVLARDLGLARNTVANAYGQLVAEGWLTARPGAGTRVAAVALDSATAGSDVHDQPPPLPYNMKPGVPDLSEFPRGAWLAAARRSISRVPDEAFSYGDPRGHIELRRALAEYLARARGVRTTPDRIMICSGAMHGLSTLCTALSAGGVRTVAVESVGFYVHWNVIRATAGLGLAPLAVDESGARTDQLRSDGAQVALLTPAHQFPTGVALAPPRRAAAVDWARRLDGLLIEDDYDGEFRYDGQPVGALQALDPERVVYLGSASKTLAPGLRLGWMVLPQRLVEPVSAIRTVTDTHSGVFEQLTLAELIRSGAYDRHVRRARLGYRQRRDRLVTALSERAPQVQLTGIAAGLHALVRLPGVREDEEAAVGRAASLGLAITGLAAFRYRRRPMDQAGLVVGYAKPAGHAFSGALNALCATLA